jgi:tetratricopeptide (TPR) repeat protein
LYQPNTPQYYPVVFTSFWIEHRIYGGDDRYGTNPFGYHFANLLLHISNALLIIALLRRVGVSPVIAWAISILFALHPVQVESVAWVTERKNLLSTFFYLLAALAYLKFDAQRFPTPLPLTSGRGLISPLPAGEGSGVMENRRNPWSWYALALVLFLLALLSKSVAASLPVAIVIMLLFMRERLSLARLWPLVPVLLLGAAAGLNTGYLERVHVGAVGPDWESSWIERALIGSRALLFYPWKIIAPADLVFIYPRWEIDARDFVQWLPLLVEFMAAALLVWLWWKKEIRWPLLAAAFYAVTIFPALGFANIYPMRFSFVADHFQYLACTGVLAICAAGIASVVRTPRAFVICTIVLGVALGALTFAQARLYRDEITLYTSIVERNPQAWMAHSNLARKLIDEASRAREAGDEAAFTDAVTRAERHARAATDLRGDNERPWTNLAEALRLQNRLLEALQSIRRGIDALQTERDWLESRGHMRKVLWADYHLAIDYGSMAGLYDALGDADAAIDAYEAALRIVPVDAGTIRLRLNLHTRLADLLTRLDRLADAALHYEFVLSQHPDDFLAHLVVGEHARRERQYQTALAHFRTAIQVVNSRDEELQAMYRLGWLLATASDDEIRDGALAAELGEAMIQGTGGTSPDAFDLYAAALAELGRFEDAATMAEEALSLTAAHELTGLDARIRARVELYRRNQPYRE